MNPNNSAEALNQIKQAQTTALTPQQYLTNQQNALGVSQQREAAQGLRGAIANTTKLLGGVAPSVAGRGANSLMTAAQQNRIVQNETAPIANTLQNQNQQYSSTIQDLNDLESRAAQLANAEYQGQQDKLSYLQNIYNTLYQREEAEKERQEQIRQFNEQMAESRRASGGAGGGAGGYGGFDVGSVISAIQGGSKAPTAEKKYIGNDDYRGRLRYEASKGNKDAAVLLKYVGNDGISNSVVSKAEYDILKRNKVKGNYRVASAPVKSPINRLQESVKNATTGVRA